MSERTVQFGFTAGEIAPELYGRGDFDRFSLAVAEATNFFVDYRGGLTSRPGQYYIGPVMEDNKDVVLFPFQFGTNVSNTYIIVAGENYFRFVQDGGYVLEGAINITGVTAANPGVVSAVNTYVAGDWVYITGITGMTELNNRYFKVANPTGTTFELQDVYGNNIDTTAYTAYGSSGTVARLYTVVTPYAAAHLRELHMTQNGDTIRITNVNYAPRKLVRTASTNWTLSAILFVNNVASPAVPTGTGSGAGSAGVSYQITTVDADGIESIPSHPFFLNSIIHLPTAAGTVDLSWAAVAGAARYNVYRTIFHPDHTKLTLAQPFGFVGEVLGPRFNDVNIIAEFDKTPPILVNPFAQRAIAYIGVSASGASYGKGDTVTISDPTGTGFKGYPVIDSAGGIYAIVILSAGENYTAPTVVITTSTGSGATFSVTVSAASDTYPATNTNHQQRTVYAGTNSAPLKFWGTGVNRPDDFSSRFVPTDADAYSYELDGAADNPIRHAISIRGGLLLMTNNEIWLVSGEGQTITPNSVGAEPQFSVGSDILKPIKLDRQILILDDTRGVVYAIDYIDGTVNAYAGTDISILANHFFSSNNSLISWAYVKEPHRVIWGAKDNGDLLCLTYVPNEKVIAWTRCQTKGLYSSVETLREGNDDNCYFIVKRYVNGRWSKFIERQAPREINTADEYCGLDCAVTNTLAKPAADLTIAASSGTNVLITASANVFSAGDVNSYIRAGCGMALITSYVSATQVRVTWLYPVLDVLPQDATKKPLPVLSGEWTLAPPITEATGLWHLEGETVSIVADGKVLQDAVVANGKATLSEPVTRYYAGLPYTCLAKTLPLVDLELGGDGRIKRLISAKLRTRKSRGLSVGTSLATMYDIKNRTTETYGMPPNDLPEVSLATVSPRWADEQLYIKQAYPLPASILGYTLNMELGDDKD